MPSARRRLLPRSPRRPTRSPRDGASRPRSSSRQGRPRRRNHDGGNGRSVTAKPVGAAAAAVEATPEEESWTKESIRPWSPSWSPLPLGRARTEQQSSVGAASSKRGVIIPRCSSESLSPAVGSATRRRSAYDKQQFFSLGETRKLGMLERAVISAQKEVLCDVCVRVCVCMYARGEIGRPGSCMPRLISCLSMYRKRLCWARAWSMGWCFVRRVNSLVWTCKLSL